VTVGADDDRAMPVDDSDPADRDLHARDRDPAESRLVDHRLAGDREQCGAGGDVRLWRRCALVGTPQRAQPAATRSRCP
jgi:hypothetical protein